MWTLRGKGRTPIHGVTGHVNHCGQLGSVSLGSPIDLAPDNPTVHGWGSRLGAALGGMNPWHIQHAPQMSWMHSSHQNKQTNNDKKIQESHRRLHLAVVRRAFRAMVRAVGLGVRQCQCSPSGDPTTWCPNGPNPLPHLHILFPEDPLKDGPTLPMCLRPDPSGGPGAALCRGHQKDSSNAWMCPSWLLRQ